MNPKTKTLACQTALRALKGAEDEQLDLHPDLGVLAIYLPLHSS